MKYRNNNEVKLVFRNKEYIARIFKDKYNSLDEADFDSNFKLQDLYNAVKELGLTELVEDIEFNTNIKQWQEK